MNRRPSLLRRFRGARRRVQDALRPRARSGASSVDAPDPEVAILVVNGFDRRGRWGEFNVQEARTYPWIRLCLQQIERHSRTASYEVLVWDNSWLPRQRQLLREHPRVRMFNARTRGDQFPHGDSLDRLVKKVRPGTKYVITLDTDSFPIRDGWIENLTGRLTHNVWLAGVWRDEMLPKSPAFVHPCCTAVRTDRLRALDVGFKIGDGTDVGSRLTTATEAAGARVSRLHRSNRWNPHYIMGAIYGDLIYHQGAGSRNPQFRTGSAEGAEAIRQALLHQAFDDLDGLLEALAGNRDPQEAAPATYRAAQEAAAAEALPPGAPGESGTPAALE